MTKSVGVISMVALLLSANVMADDSRALRSKLEQLDSLKANFTQEVTDINDKVIQSGSGIFALAYPNKFFWHLTEPDESLIVADGSDLWIYNPFAEEVTVMDFADAVEASPIALLVHRDESTWQQYHVSQVQPESGKACYLIKPKLLDTSVVTVTVCFNDSGISDFSLLDQQGNHSQFALSEQTNVSTEEKGLFEFVIPTDVDIDDQRQSER
ncbi:Outer-membrane lipoprotein carrier protein precursor [Shewanella sp. P1-14-1]|uniref:outer membrane lipoprotein chaperone LolA n=1 Tax=Shewanella sp. P1-14-1 TaxID=1723761 RepID=UPI0006D67676|nr:outer membrane lipoprotein chaperone LolA [Shewanella sp. P1-14-1]KPZ68330.1 Outer-membrane lipoprotein carrier protein precursor [Shewanella sp. P1-14-1]